MPAATTPPIQREGIRRFAPENNLELIGEYCDFHSGWRKSEARPEFQCLMASAAEGKFDVVLVFHTSRFARTVRALRHQPRVRPHARGVAERKGRTHRPRAAVQQGHGAGDAVQRRLRWIRLRATRQEPRNQRAARADRHRRAVRPRARRHGRLLRDPCHRTRPRAVPPLLHAGERRQAHAERAWSTWAGYRRDHWDAQENRDGLQRPRLRQGPTAWQRAHHSDPSAQSALTQVQQVRELPQRPTMVRESMAQVVFLLGAGFSCSVLDPSRGKAAPLARNFFQVLMADRRYEGGLDGFRQHVFVDVLLEEIARYWHLDLDGLKTRPFDIEECLTLFESQLGRSRGRTRVPPQRTRRPRLSSRVS
jgi:Resolvase, N terminal domain